LSGVWPLIGDRVVIRCGKLHGTDMSSRGFGQAKPSGAANRKRKQKQEMEDAEAAHAFTRFLKPVGDGSSSDGGDKLVN